MKHGPTFYTSRNPLETRNTHIGHLNHLRSLNLVLLGYDFSSFKHQMKPLRCNSFVENQQNKDFII